MSAARRSCSKAPSCRRGRWRSAASTVASQSPDAFLTNGAPRVRRAPIGSGHGPARRPRNRPGAAALRRLRAPLPQARRSSARAACGGLGEARAAARRRAARRRPRLVLGAARGRRPRDGRRAQVPEPDRRRLRDGRPHPRPAAAGASGRRGRAGAGGAAALADPRLRPGRRDRRARSPNARADDLAGLPASRRHGPAGRPSAGPSGSAGRRGSRPTAPPRAASCWSTTCSRPGRRSPPAPGLCAAPARRGSSPSPSPGGCEAAAPCQALASGGGQA